MLLADRVGQDGIANMAEETLNNFHNAIKEMLKRNEVQS